MLHLSLTELCIVKRGPKPNIVAVPCPQVQPTLSRGADVFPFLSPKMGRAPRERVSSCMTEGGGTIAMCGATAVCHYNSFHLHRRRECPPKFSVVMQCESRVTFLLLLLLSPKPFFIYISFFTDFHLLH